MSETVYSAEEREKAIARMQEASNLFYSLATRTGCHTFVEFCGLMNEFIKICEAASTEGVDFMIANRHTGAPLPIERYHAEYLGEKMGCIYGPSFKDPEVFKAFVAALELPFDVKIGE